MSSYDNFFQEQMRDPEVKAEYDALEPKFSIIQAIIDARKESGLTQNVQEQQDRKEQEGA
ncbi:hypothetical protein [uncultured Selenomonas sp.]|uniref:hypothetical protein n=1 Tax=uncultured Selenomonas sp. TaxID=159275 RepID=UPI002588FED7|nr:hypothetical protein [uncultured Selenomonas sp.]